MQEKIVSFLKNLRCEIIKTFETLSRRGKNIDEIDKNELVEILRNNIPQ